MIKANTVVQEDIALLSPFIPLDIELTAIVSYRNGRILQCLILLDCLGDLDKTSLVLTGTLCQKCVHGRHSLIGVQGSMYQSRSMKCALPGVDSFFSTFANHVRPVVVTLKEKLLC